MHKNSRFSPQTVPSFTPFWRRLPRFLLYPLQMGAMMRIAGYSALSGIFTLLPFMLHGLLRLLVWVMFFKYAFLVIERTSNGKFDEPNGLDGEIEGDTSQVMRQFGLFVVLALLFALLTVLFGKVGYGVGWFLINVIPPAGIMIIVVHHSLKDALNPAQIFFYIKTIGSPYLALCFILLSLTSGTQWLQQTLGASINMWIAVPILSFIGFYFTLVTYHMMGYVLYQYHEKLGIGAEVDFDEAQAKLTQGKNADLVLTKLATLMAKDQKEEAIDLLREALLTRGSENDLHDRYQKLLVDTGKHSLALEHAGQFISKLASENRFSQALDLCEQSFNLDPKFQLPNGDYIHKLASVAHSNRRSELAVKLMSGFDKRYPGHTHTALIYFLSAQVLNEHYQQHQQALQILEALTKKFPEHECLEHAQKYMERVQKKLAAN